MRRFDRDVGDGDEQDAALHRRIVARADRLHQQPSDARPREDRFGDHRAGQHRPELQPEHRDDRNEAVAERVTRAPRAVRDTPRARAASTYSSRNSSRTLARVIRASIAASGAPSVIAGSTRLRRACRDPRPETSPARPKTRSPAADRARNSASRCRPARASSRRDRRACPARTAAIMPSGMANDQRDEHRRQRELEGRRHALGDRRGDRLIRSAATCRDRRRGALHERHVLHEQRPIEPEPRRAAARCPAATRFRPASPAPDRRARGGSARTPAWRRRAAPGSSAAGGGGESGTSRLSRTQRSSSDLVFSPAAPSAWSAPGA